MKKIVYLLGAAMLVSSSAVAVAPAKSQAVSAKLEKTTLSREISRKSEVSRQMVSTPSIQSVAQKQGSRAGEIEEVQSLSALYANSSGAFYLGLTPGFGLYRGAFGFTGIRNGIMFNSLPSDAASHEWSYEIFEGRDENGVEMFDTFTSTEENLPMMLKPLREILSPVHKVSGNGETDEYQTEVISYYTGMSPVEWGFVDPELEEIPVSDYPGVTVCTTKVEGITTVGYFTRNTVPSAASEKNYLANGTFVGWKSYFADTDNYKVTDIRTKGFGTYVPSKPSPYMLTDMWSYFLIKCTEGVSISSYVYEIKEDGVDYSHPLARAEVSFDAGTFPSDNDDMPVFNYYALDEDGYETDSPLCVDAFTPVFVTIEGIDNAAIEDFRFAMVDDTVVPVDADDTYIDYMTPSHAWALMEVDLIETGKTEPTTISTEVTCPSLYWADDAQTAIYVPADFIMNFNVYFPVVMNGDEESELYESAYFESVLPAQGGEATSIVYSDYNLSALIDQELMTVESSDWLTYSVEQIEPALGSPYTQVTVKAEALPAGSEGRQGAVVFSGFACDFTINVVQAAGDENSISNVAAANGKVQLFDLQGRRLMAAPANGIYLERQGNKTTKRIALN